MLGVDEGVAGCAGCVTAAGGEDRHTVSLEGFQEGVVVFPLNIVVFACFVSDLNRYAHAFSFFCSDAFLLER